MARLPVPGEDDGAWGDILNNYLLTAHQSDGTLKANAVDSTSVQNNSISSAKLQSDSVTEPKLAASGGVDGQVLTKDSAATTGLSWTSVASGGATNLTSTSTGTSVTILSDTGTDAVIGTATGVVAGVLSAADKTKLNGIQAGAEANTVDSVNSATGAVVLDSDDIAEGTTNLYYTNARVSANANVAANTAARHTHANKALLDTYTQTEANLADAVVRRHSHANQAVLDATTASFTTADETKLDAIEAGAEVNDVFSVAGKTGAVTLNTGDVTESANLYYTNARADARIAAASVNALSDVTLTTPTTGQVLKYNGTAWVNDTDNIGSAGTNLATTRTATDVTIVSDTGTDAIVAAADATNAGVLTSADKTKLDGIAAGAQVNNISDANATDLTDGTASTLHFHAADRSRANHTGTQLAATVSDFSAAADARIAAASVNALADVTVTTPSTGQVLKYNGTAWINDTDATGAGGTNLTATLAAATVTINSDTGADVTIASADATNAGVLTSTDKVKLDAIESGATADQVAAEVPFTPNGDIIAGDVQNAIVEVRNDTDTKLATKSDTTHIHDTRYYTETETDILLDAKSDTTHSHLLDALSDVTLTTPTTGQVLKYNGTAWVNDTDNIGSAGTNLATTRTATDVTIVSDTGTDAIVAAADATNAGVLTSADKTKLDGIAAGAQVNSVTSVAGKTGAVTLVKADVGLANVDNTSDANKPISTATQTALNAKLNTSARGAASGVASLDTGTKVPIAELPTGTAAGTVALGNHNHDTQYATTTHIHDDRYYTETENNALLAAKESTANKGVANGYASLDANTRVPTAQLPVARTPVALTDATTIATNAALGTHFRVTLAGNRTLGAPTNPSDGQKVIWEFTQDATGSRTITLATGAGGFMLGTDITTVTLTTTAGRRDYLGAVYHVTANSWHVIAFTRGF